MTYTGLAVIGIAVAIALDLLLLRTNLLLHKAFWVSYAIVVFFQLVSNGVLTGLPIVRYDAGSIIGARLVYAPVEDLLFGFAMVVVTLSVWVAVGRLQRVEPATPPAGR
jgi:lycopene cyclase domain-containing protein